MSAASETASSQDPAAAQASSARVKHPVTARTKARRRAIEILFEADQRGMLNYGASCEADAPQAQEHVQRQAMQAAESLRALTAERAEHSANQTQAPAYTRQILAGVADHLSEIDQHIETYAQGWTLSRMPAVDRAIARVTTWEIIYNDDVDVPVALDEAQTLAKMLSTEDSPRYLGGVLGRIGDLAETLR